ncbi:MAG: UDP-3-O-(3-hydroxymyristoyl)glucosamine N-acyltransferase [Synergistaceae bacterium]|jgi:UDP-3-O-[3-hydroxymyristoyl] glucosamine N-acyltransferase|nr:UDP-3-O-(3-hydroxymyristoyl)glucosamine N-acyltransferase [Synergistaceae bacterium]
MITLSELGEKLGLPVVGDGALIVTGVSAPEAEEKRPGSICVVWDKRSPRMENMPPGVMMIGRPELFKPGMSGLASGDPRGVLPALLPLFAPPRTDKRGIHWAAAVAKGAHVSNAAWVGPMCVVEDGASIGNGARLLSSVFVGSGASIGDGTVIEPNVSIMQGVRIGKNCVVHANTAIGCDGFGFLPGPDGLVKIPQIGGVEVGDDVEIGACCAIDRGAIGDTVVGDGTKIDNHVQIGHNVKIGRHCVICAMSGIAGSSVVEDGVTIAVQVGVTDHARIGAGATLAGRAGVTNDVPPGLVVSGFPARPHGEAKRAQVLAMRLPELYERIRRLERLNKIEP